MKIIRLNNKEILSFNIFDDELDEIQNHNIHNCQCTQCRGVKRNKHLNTKKLFKRIMNKKRRQLTNKPKHYTHYWA